MRLPVWNQFVSRSASAWRKIAAAAPWRDIAIWSGAGLAVLIVAFALFITFADWNALRQPLARIASNMSGRPIAITGDLIVRPWSLTPEARIGGLVIGNPPAFRTRGRFATVRQANVAVRLLPLLVGKLDVARLDLDGADVALYRAADGASNWQGRPGRPFDLPAIQHFDLRHGRLTLDDEKRHMRLNATFNSQETAAHLSNGRFLLSGGGEINGQPFRVDAAGAALLNVRRDRPYDFTLDVHAGSTHVVARGAITRPFDLSHFRANLDAAGADLADLYYLLGLALPNTPPYHLVGRVDRNGDRYAMTGLAGRIGDSDLAGQFTVTRRADDRPYLEAALRSDTLDWDDLMTVFGAPPSVAAGETASRQQRAEARELATEGRILPDAKLDISRVRNMDARVRYAATHVRSPHLPLRAASVSLTLDHGVLHAEPIDLDLTQGHVGGAATIDARQAVPQSAVDLRLTHARIESFIPVSGQPISGPLSARVRLSGRGASVREAAADADGNVSLVAPSGDVRAAFAELTGINVARGLGLLLAHDQSKIGIRCALADFRVRNGVLNTNSIVVDTDTMLITGGGTVSLRDERMDLHIKGQPKEARLIRIAAPIAVRGHIRDPSIGLEPGRAAGQTGIAALLASVLAPVAGVLPFIDPGLADDANCAALFAEARSNGARPS